MSLYFQSMPLRAAETGDLNSLTGAPRDARDREGRVSAEQATATLAGEPRFEWIDGADAAVLPFVMSDGRYVDAVILDRASDAVEDVEVEELIRLDCGLPCREYNLAIIRAICDFFMEPDLMNPEHRRHYVTESVDTTLLKPGHEQHSEPLLAAGRRLLNNVFLDDEGGIGVPNITLSERVSDSKLKMFTREQLEHPGFVAARALRADIPDYFSIIFTRASRDQRAATR